MANPADKVQVWTTNFLDLKRKMPLEAGSTITGLSDSLTFYTGEMIGIDSAGNAAHMDDAQTLKFAGIACDLQPPIVGANDAAGGTNTNPNRVTVDKPAVFSAKIASAAAGDEGKKVYAKYSDEVQYSCGTYANEVGEVLYVIDSTHVAVAPPWSPLTFRGGAYRGVISGNAATATTLTRDNLNKIVLLPLTSSETVNLPAIAGASPGDRLLLVNTSSNSSVPTLDGHSSETINGGLTFAMSATQYATAELVYDGTEWVVNVPSLTIGGTNFTGAVSVASTSADAFDVGANGTTHPALEVDASTSSSATGIKIKSAAAAAGVAVSTISSGTDESLTLDAKGAGTVTINGTATGKIVLARETSLSVNLDGSIGGSTAAAGSTNADAAGLPAGTALVYPTTAADGTKGVIVDVADKVTGRMLFIGNGVANQILKVYPPSGGTINGGSANAAFSSVSGKGVIIVCLSSSGNTWLAW